MFPTLEGFYRRLMLAYPASYRQVREDEVVGTLLEASRPGQRLPSLRETVGLLRGGLRTRAWLNRDGGTAGDWGDSLRLAAALLTASSAMQAIPILFFQLAVPSCPMAGPNSVCVEHPVPLGLILGEMAVPLVLTLTALALLRGTGRWGLVLVLVDVLLLRSDSPVWSMWVPDLLPLATATAAFAWRPALRRRSPRWPWWFTGVTALGPSLLGLFWFVHRGWDPLLLQPALAVQVVAAFVLAAAALVTIDPRPALGAAIAFVAAATSAWMASFFTPLSLFSLFSLSLQGRTGLALSLLLGTGCLAVSGLSWHVARRT